MYGAERQQLLAQRARRDGRIDVMAAAAELEVAPETIRRDLGALERQGLVRRVYGGAIPVGRIDFEPGVTQRDKTNAAEKERIARAAVDLLPQRGTLLLDAGTTTGVLAAPIQAVPGCCPGDPDHPARAERASAGEQRRRRGCRLERGSGC